MARWVHWASFSVLHFHGNAGKGVRWVSCTAVFTLNHQKGRPASLDLKL